MAFFPSNNNNINKPIKYNMQFGPLTTHESIDQYFNQMRTQSRSELLKKLYRTSEKPNIPENKIQSDLVNAFGTLLNTYNYDYSNPIVKEILSVFEIKEKDIINKNPHEREDYLQKKIMDNLDLTLKSQRNSQQTIQYTLPTNRTESSEFDWVGVKSHFPSLRSIFQQILLEKVRLFDKELTQLTEVYHGKDMEYDDLMGSTRPFTASHRKTVTQSNQIQQNKRTLNMKKKIHKNLQKKGFTNVLIRDHSEFMLSKWTKKEEKEFRQKKTQFRNNFRKYNNQTPIIFQFVKKYTNTVKARDNIYQKWEHRQKTGITPQQLRYLCSTSLFLNKTLAGSEKKRINQNIQSAGKELISKLEFNISEKIIQTYKQFVKKVSDLRAHYYEELTEERKKEFSKHKKQETKEIVEYKKKTQFQKFKQIFNRICKSQRMSTKLRPRVYRWVKLFIKNMKQRIEKKDKSLNMKVFRRLNSTGVRNVSPLLIKTKLRCPSSRVIKREDHSGYRNYIKKYIPTERFKYQESFENHIKEYNKIKIKKKDNYRKQLSGGPNSGIKDYIYVDLSKKRLEMTSKSCLKAIIMIQAKWKAIYQRRIYITMRDEHRQELEKDFQERLKSLKTIYPKGKKIDLRSLQNRLKRVSMRTLNVLKPYVRVVKKPINNYTAFCGNKLTLNEMKIKNAKNSSRRMQEFGKMVMENHFKQLMRSGFVLTAKQINEPMYNEKASAMWWAAKNSNVELTRIFLEGGGYPNSANQQNNTCLHEALQNGALEVIFLLLDYGADLNIKNNKKVTPLYYATPKMLKLLGLEEGSVSGSEALKDNNGLYFNPSTITDFYPDHYY